ncbi:MAG: hypothetical protein ACLGG2_06985, partial [Gammaproteobacteria bacterium]
MIRHAAMKKAGRSRARPCGGSVRRAEAVAVHQLPVELAVFDDQAVVLGDSAGHRHFGRKAQHEVEFGL